ncbi:MAG: hypothetical protein WC994_03935 [Brumimicrobium sp.]
MKFLPSKTFNVFSLALFLVLFVYLTLRVFLVGPIHDELATLVHYIDYGTFWKNAPIDANNHLLNSFLSKVAYSIFGDNIWAIRLPNLFFFILFFYSTYRITHYLEKKYLKYILLISFSCIPYVLDYFAYSRGYGISMALLITAIWLFIEVNIQYNSKKMFWLGFTLALSIYANLNLIITLLLIFGYIFIKLLLSQKTSKISNRKANVKSFVIISVVFALSLIPAVIFAYKLKTTGALYYGNDDGLWLTTGATLSGLVLNTTTIFIKYILIALTLTLVIHTIYQLSTKPAKEVFSQPSILFIGLFLGNIIAIELMNLLMDVNYPEDRVGMQLIFLLIGSVIFTSQHYGKTTWLSAIFLLLPIVGWKHFNFDSSAFSPDDRMEKADFELFISEISNDESSCLYLTQQLPYAYHVRKTTPDNFVVPDLFTLGNIFDQEIVSTKKDGRYENGIYNPYNEEKIGNNYETLSYNPRTWQHIVKRKGKINWKIIQTKTEVSDELIEEMYYSFIDTTFADKSSKKLKYKVVFTVNTPELVRENLALVVDKASTKEGIRKWDGFGLNWASGKLYEYTVTKIVEVDPSYIDAVKLYLYSPKLSPFKVLKQETTLMIED